MTNISSELSVYAYAQADSQASPRRYITPASTATKVSMGNASALFRWQQIKERSWRRSRRAQQMDQGTRCRRNRRRPKKMPWRRATSRMGSSPPRRRPAPSGPAAWWLCPEGLRAWRTYAEGGQCNLADIRQGIPYVSQPRPFGLRPVVFLLKHHIKNGAEALEMQSGAEALERNSPKWLRTC